MKKIKNYFDNDINSHVLWLPVFFSIGIILQFYFRISCSIFLFVIISFLFFIFKNYYARCLFVSLFFIIFGYYRSYNFIEKNKHQIIDKKRGYVYIEGILKKEILRKNYKNKIVKEIIVESSKINGKNEKVLLKIRLIDNKINLYKGKVLVKANLFPIENIPFGFNLKRYYYFQGIGGLGYRGRILYNEKNYGKKNISDIIDEIRVNVANRIISVRDSSSSGIIAILLTGKKDMADKKAMEYMNYSGMAHLLSISGLHMMTLISIVFFISKYFLLRFERIVLNYNVFKISAFISLLVNFLYLLLSGSSVSAVRAYLMSVILLISIFIGRFNTSIRSVMFVMFVVLFFKPNLIFSVGFQMSFIAVISLISCADLLYTDKFNNFNKLKKFLLIGFFTSFIAECATTPFSIYNFNNYSFYNIFVNSFLTPLVSFIVLPLSLLSMILYPFHLENIFILPASYVMDFVLYVSKIITELPKSIFFIPSPNLYSLFFMIFGLIWFSLWKEKWRWFGIFYYLVGLFIFFFQKNPDVIITKNSIFMIDSGKAFIYTNNKYESFSITKKFGIKDYYFINNNHTNCNKSKCTKIIIGKRNITFIKNDKMLKINKSNKNIIKNRYIKTLIAK